MPANVRIYLSEDDRQIYVRYQQAGGVASQLFSLALRLWEGGDIILKAAAAFKPHYVGAGKQRKR